MTGRQSNSWGVCALLLTLGACAAPVGVRETGFEPVYRSFRANVLDEGKLSAAGKMALAYFNLLDLYGDDPGGAVAELEDIASRERLRPLYAALAEMHYHIALRNEDRARFLESAIHAYVYLFGEGFHDEPNPYSPHFRLACDLYNRGLAKAMQVSTGEVTLDGGLIETPSGAVTIEVTRPGFPWGEDDFSRFLASDAFEVRGLRERVRARGLGVPLIAVQSERDSGAALASEHVGQEVKLPATAFLRVNGGLAELEAGTLTATLELYLGADVPTVELGERTVPLETDITAPLAYMLEDSKLWGFAFKAFIWGSSESADAGVFMLQPYQPDKIPLVLIHGTASSPAAWAQTINGIMADRRIQAKYQVWLGLYNTGNPIAYSAAQQREALLALVADLDPEGDDEQLPRMVLVGHSQGGLVARLLVTSSGEPLWRTVADVPFEEYEMSDENREFVRRVLFFEPLPFVERVVFISTPHGGSFLAGNWIGALSRKLVRLPQNIAKTAENLTRRSDLPPELRRFPTSIDNMKPGSKFVEAVATLPFGDVEMHSIVAVRGKSESYQDGNDGVVKYTSAHLDEAKSELVVRHGHSCQGEPETIGELRRILFEHLRETGQATGTAPTPAHTDGPSD